jgi:hypothetical protein
VPLLVVEIEMDDAAKLVVAFEMETPATYVGPVEREVHDRLNVILKAEVIVTFEGNASGGLKEM